MTLQTERLKVSRASFGVFTDEVIPYPGSGMLEDAALQAGGGPSLRFQPRRLAPNSL